MNDREIGYPCGCIYILQPHFSEEELPELEHDNKLVVTFSIVVSNFCKDHLREAAK